MCFEYPLWLQELIEKKYKCDTYKAAEDPEYIAFMQEHPYVFADAFWCFPKRNSEMTLHYMFIIRAAILKSFKRENQRLEWHLKSQTIRPCRPTQCAYCWCCIRAAKDKPFTPKPTDHYF
jgi:hypothetical protein